ncbi:MAG: MBL fold metallo-hydrolase [Candidatus Thalassarchaeaceae archaeon]|jgi:glyoxylase-like metal-dependent hydrolase (beta-lactamase superfamily II)|nr:MBL fold metallo-hydrolase [Candidatus Thalassarchaeaceae archaeon]
MRLHRLPGIHHDSSCIIVSGSEATCIVDPGTTWYQANLVERLKPYILDRSPLTSILLTHRHYDSCGAAPYLAEEYNAIIRIHSEGIPSLSGGDMFTTWANRYGSDMPIIDAEGMVEGEIISLGDVSLQVIHTPGHTSDSCSFFIPEKKAIICGDLIPAAGHPVRADMPTGVLTELQESLVKVMDLKPEMIICGRDEAIIGSELCYAVVSKHMHSVETRIENKGMLPTDWPKPAETCHWLTPSPAWDFD